MADMQTLLQKAFAAFDNSEFDRALILYQQALTDHTPDPDTQHHIRYMIAFTHAQAGQHDTARHIYQMLLNRTDHIVKQHRLLHQLAMVERLAENYNRARTYLSREQVILTALPDARPMAHAANLYEQGILHYLEGQHQQAKHTLRQALHIAKQSGDPVSRACALRGLGDAYAATDQTCAAQTYYQRSLNYFQQANNTQGADEIEARLRTLDAKSEQET